MSLIIDSITQVPGIQYSPFRYNSENKKGSFIVGDIEIPMSQTVNVLFLLLWYEFVTTKDIQALGIKRPYDVIRRLKKMGCDIGISANGNNYAYRIKSIPGFIIVNGGFKQFMPWESEKIMDIRVSDTETSSTQMIYVLASSEKVQEFIRSQNQPSMMDSVMEWFRNIFR